MDGSAREKRLSRLFSLRKVSSSGRCESPPESEGGISPRGSAPVVLGSPPPSGLCSEALKRRHIVQTLLSSENNYLAALERILNDYKKPLESSSPPLLSPSKVSTLFHRIPDILQIHLLFRLALRGVISTWDASEKIGDVFVASFSKASVLETYSDFINNFSEASSLLSKASGKSRFGDFLSLRQISSHDRLSLFGLLVKPVQRFPQFILLLQDLLRETPPGHPDRMALQLALTTLESLAEMLNERKREAEQFAAFREKMKSLGGGGRGSRGLLETPRDSTRYLLKEEDVHQLEYNAGGNLLRSKARRLLLVNDALLCASVSGRFSEVELPGGPRRRLSLKWAVPLRDVEVLETAGRTLQGSANSKCSLMADLMSDFETLSRVKSLLEGLKGSYEGLGPGSVNESLCLVQRLIRERDEEMCSREDSTLVLGFRSKDLPPLSFRTADPNVRRDWATEVRLAQLGLHPDNSPAWDVLEDERSGPLAKLPLYVTALPLLSEEKSPTELTVGLSYTLSLPGGGGRMKPKESTYVWLSAYNGVSSILKIFSHPSYKELASLRHNSHIKHMEFVPGCDGSEELSLRSSLVWISTKRMIIIYSASDPERFTEVTRFSVPSDISSLLYAFDSLWIGLSNGVLATLKRSPISGYWDLSHPNLLKLHSSDPLNVLLPGQSCLYAAWGNTIGLLDVPSVSLLKSFSIKCLQESSSSCESTQTIAFMSSSGVGLWVALSGSPVICLYHTETFRHLQDINIASNVTRVLSARDVRSPGRRIHVSALLAVRGLLWVGTNVGITLTVPLPRLEGVPIISGRANISYHAHFGPVCFFLNVSVRRCPSYSMRKVHSVIPEESIGEEAAVPCSTSPLRKMNSEGVLPPPSAVNKGGKTKALRLSSSPVLLKRENRRRSSRTLPRPSMLSSESEVHSLYGDLFNVPVPIERKPHAPTRKSDPDLSSSLSRPPPLNRPKSLDMSSWSMESRQLLSSSSSSSSSSSANNTPGVSRNASFASNSSSFELHTDPPPSSNSSSRKGKESGLKTLSVLMGGRGIINWRLRDSRTVNNSDAYLVVWEMKL